MIEKFQMHITIPPRRINAFYPSLDVSFVVLFSWIVGVSTVYTMFCSSGDPLHVIQLEIINITYHAIRSWIMRSTDISFACGVILYSRTPKKTTMILLSRCTVLDLSVILCFKI
jgi:hypothetical protein